MLFAGDEGKLEVKVDNGWVTLEGDVDWEYQKVSAQSSVENLLSVTGVTNHIQLSIRSIDPQQINDEIKAAFVRSAQVDSKAVQVEVSGNRVTLFGTVRSWVEKEQAEQIAWSSPGVLVVDNRINIDADVFT
jgi:osmotically-inducible protein OsmY